MEVREVLCDNHLLKDLERPISLNDCAVIGKLHPCVGRMLGNIMVGRELRLSSKSFSKNELPGGTWREMFIIQPPCEKGRVRNSRAMFDFNILFGEPASTAGVTLGEICDFFSANVFDQHQGYGDYMAVCNFADENNMPHDRLFASRCQVRAGEVCRPAGLPLPVAYPDTESSDDSGDNDNDDDDEDDGNWGGYYDGGDFADEDLRNDDYLGEVPQNTTAGEDQMLTCEAGRLT